MQSHIDSIIHRPVCSVGIVKRIQQRSRDVLQVGQDQSLKWLHDHRRENDRSVVVKASDLGISGDRNDGGAFEAAGNFAQLQRSVEDLCKYGGSWSAQTFRQAGEIPSGPEAFLAFCFLKTRFTSSTQTLSAGRMVVEGGSGVAARGAWWMCEVQIRVGAGCQSGLFKLAVKDFQIISQLLILHRLWGRCLVLGDIPQTNPYRIVFGK